jgi:putative membrane protein insertion efficiency factor
MKTFVLGLLAFYKTTLSPTLPSACKYYPSCSVYAREAVERYGTSRGLWMALRRLLRCRPFHAGGFDPVP